MAYLGVLPEVPTFAQTFSRNISEGLSRGASKGFNTAQKLMIQQGKGRKSLGLKGFNDAYKAIEKFKSNTFNDEDKSEITKQYAQLRSENPDVNEEEILQHAINQYAESRKEREGISKPKGNDAWEQARHETEQGHPLGALGEYLQPGYETAKKHPSQLAKELPVAGSKSLESFAALQDPSQLIASLLGGKKPLQPSDILAQSMRGNLGEEEKEGAERIAQAESFLLDWLGPVAGKKIVQALTGAKGLGAAAEIAPEIQAAQKAGLGEEVIKDVGKIAPELEAAERGSALEAKITEGKPSSATEMRIERLDPTSKIYKPKEQAALREFQMKLVPQYEAEIAEDAAARAARAAAKEPKTEVGLAGRAKRAETAEARLPEVQKSYQKAIARVRALEDEVSGLRGVQREQGEKILEAATKELNNAEFELHQAMENLKGVNTRAGIESMEKAAQTKLQKISEMAAGEDAITLAKMDYSPEYIKQAKAISKSRKLKANKIDDFYTQVHDTYANQYRQRLAQLDQEMAGAMEQRSMAGLHQRRQIDKEREAIRKLIESAEAENTVHRHKLALREMQQRKIASERFKKLKSSEGNAKAKEVFGQKAWKKKIEDAKTPEARAEIIDEATEVIAEKTPVKSEAVKKEGDGLKGAIERVRQQAENLKNPPQAEKSAKTFVQQHIQKWKEEIESFKSSFPNILNSFIGRQLISGILGAAYDDLKKEYDIPFSAGTLTTAAFGGTPRGIPIRALVNSIAKGIIKDIHIKKAAEAYNRSDMKKFNDYPPSIQKKAKEKIRGF